MIKKIKKLGFNLIPCLIQRINYSLLRLVFHFERWHAKSPYSCHQYKKKCVEVVKEVVSPLSVIEIGCGLGEILCRIPAPSRIGIDVDHRVINAANYIARNQSNIQFYTGTFAQVEEVATGKLDLLIMINFVHLIEPDELKLILERLFFKVDIRWLLVDEIIEKDNHRIKHRFSKILPEIFVEHSRFIDDVNVREMILYRKIA